MKSAQIGGAGEDGNIIVNPKNRDDDNDDDDGLSYLAGFGNDFESSCLPGALPVGRNTPRRVPFGLYTEQISGTAFTKPRASHNRRTWLYRVQPSVASTVRNAKPLRRHPTDTMEEGENSETSKQQEPIYFGHTSPDECEPVVDPLRWHPRPMKQANESTSSSSSSSSSMKKQRITFVEGCQLMCHGGSVAQKHGLAIYLYQFNASMESNSMYNADGEFLIVPQEGRLEILSELGRLRVRPKEIVVIPRGIVFSVQLLQSQQPQQTGTSTNDITAQGYVLEVYGGDGFQLPELGPIGANGLANPRDFLYPTAWCTSTVADKQDEPQHEVRGEQQQEQSKYTITIKMQSRLFERESDHSPFNVAAWHGNYAPYKYNLERFCVVNSVSYDHLDPSIFTVLTCPSYMIPGTALADFVIFPPRYLATDHNTFRPPYFHRNTMSEYMGIICGQYDGKPSKGAFCPGGASLHNCMTPHGPDREAYERAVEAEEGTPQPVQYLDNGLAFMFETYLTMTVTPLALEEEGWRDVEYARSSWHGLGPARYFRATA